MIVDFRSALNGFTRIFLFTLMGFVQQLQASQSDTTLMPVRALRIAIYVFQDDAGQKNFHPDSVKQVAFLHDLTDWVNHRLANLDTLRPAMPSAFVGDTRVRVRLDTIYYRHDSRAWDCSSAIDSPYIRDQYIDGDPGLSYQDKYQTLPIFIGGNYNVIGGHSRNIGDRGYIAVRGYYENFMTQPRDVAIDECGRNLVHELGHCLGLVHNFQGGPGGDQCDDCDDNGCPLEGTSNNLMDYWPAYGYALSMCQFNKIHFYLDGGSGNISEVVINDSCYKVEGMGYEVRGGETLVISDTVYAHQDWRVREGGSLIVKGYLSMPSDAGITLEPGAQITIDGGTVGNLCGDLWLGLRTENNSGVRPALVSVVGNGMIENARTALLATGPVDTRLDGSVFKNCEESLVFLEGSADSISINNSNFQITTKLNRYEDGITPVSFLRSQGIPRIRVSDSRFINEPGTLIFDANWMGSAIVTDALSAEIRNSEFTNLTCALDFWSQDADSRTDITDNVFSGNRYALKSDHRGIQWIKNNTFNLQRFNSGPSLGVFLRHPGRFVVFGNRFESVFGGGRLAGVVISDPSPENSPVYNNQFTNLPVGVFMDTPPDIDSVLLDWARNMGPASLLKLGPQLRFNRFDTVGIQFAIVKDSIYGSAIGDAYPIREENSLPATRWSPGGYAWYGKQLPMLAFTGWKSSGLSPKGHDLYWFMNLVAIHSGARQGLPDGTAGLKGSGWNSELANYLNRLASFAESEQWIFGSGIYKALERISDLPAALRSSEYSSYWDRFHAEDEDWIRESLGSISSRFVKADSLLTGLGTFLAEKSLDEWINIQPILKPMSGLPARPLEDYGFEFPGMNFFRFVRTAQQQSPLPAFTVYPNPAPEYIIIQPNMGYTFETAWRGTIRSSDGRQFGTFTISSWLEQKVFVTGLPAGIYIIEFYRGNQYLGAAKFIKPLRN